MIYVICVVRTECMAGRLVRCSGQNWGERMGPVRSYRTSTFNRVALCNSLFDMNFNC